MTFGQLNPMHCPACGAYCRNQAVMAAHARYSKDCTFENRFWARVEKRGPDECWHWTGRKDASGYGRIDRKGPNVYAHRVAWRLTKGEVPEGMDILHRCDNRGCCNPAHYFLGTQADNNRDAYAKGRHAWGERSRKAKITEEQVLEIIRDYRPGRRWTRSGNAAQLAEKYGLKPTTVYQIATGRSWEYLHKRLRGDGER